MSNLLVELSTAMADAAEKASLSTVMVDARRRMSASGIAFAGDLILTAHHVVERDEGIKITLADGSEVAASLAGRDPGGWRTGPYAAWQPGKVHSHRCHPVSRVFRWSAGQCRRQGSRVEHFRVWSGGGTHHPG